MGCGFWGVRKRFPAGSAGAWAPAQGGSGTVGVRVPTRAARRVNQPAGSTGQVLVAAEAVSRKLWGALASVSALA